jgi:DNA-binding XRE family transcriptional regulator
MRELLIETASFRFVQCTDFNEGLSMFEYDQPDVSAATIGGVIRSRRNHLRMTQRELAQLSGVDRKAIGKIETGKTCPRLDTLDRIALVLGRRIWMSPLALQRVAERTE